MLFSFFEIVILDDVICLISHQSQIYIWSEEW